MSRAHAARLASGPGPREATVASPPASSWTPPLGRPSAGTRSASSKEVPAETAGVIRAGLAVAGGAGGLAAGILVDTAPWATISGNTVSLVQGGSGGNGVDNPGGFGGNGGRGGAAGAIASGALPGGG